MAQDLFNNISNDYIYPDLPECPGASDSATFEFLPGNQVGIISGSSIISAMNLGDISQPVEGWVQQTKLLQPGEIIFIQGLTKGITFRTQNFIISDDVSTYSKWYMNVDLSINYYKNFKYYNDSLKATSDFTNGVSIDTALDIAFSDKGIKVTTSYIDASALIFTSTQQGYYFNITNINSSTFIPNTSIYIETLVDFKSQSLPAYKYPNSAMLGYVLKVTYPSNAGVADRFVELNHVPDELEYFENADVSIFNTQGSYTTTSYLTSAHDVSIFVSPATWEPSTYIDASLASHDVSIFLTNAIWEPSTYANTPIDVSVFNSYASYDVSTYYKRYTKAVDVGMNGDSTSTTMSAGDYLDWVQTYNKWEKVGVLKIWLTAPDPESSLIENLITGFYVFNPHEFAVKLDYMTIL